MKRDKGAKVTVERETAWRVEQYIDGGGWIGAGPTAARMRSMMKVRTKKLGVNAGKMRPVRIDRITVTTVLGETQ